MTQRIQKDPRELVNDLRENLQLLKDSLRRAVVGKMEEIRIITTLLRTLVCDNNGGLLTRIMNECKYGGEIIEDGRSIPLGTLLKKPVFKKHDGSDKTPPTYELSICDIIRNTAEQDGGAHADFGRKQEHWDMMAVLEMGISEKTNPNMDIIPKTKAIIANGFILGRNF